MKKGIVLTLLVALVLVAGVFAARAGEAGFHGHMNMKGIHGGPGGDHETMMVETLGLNDQQKAAARQIHEEMAAKGKPLMEQARQQWDEIQTLLQTTSPDPTEVGEKVIAMHAVHQQLKALHDDAATRFSALLNDEQKAKFQQLREMHDMHDRFPGPGGPGF